MCWCGVFRRRGQQKFCLKCAKKGAVIQQIDRPIRITGAEGAEEGPSKIAISEKALQPPSRSK